MTERVLEQYSRQVPTEALRVQVRYPDPQDPTTWILDVILMYKGFSSSLMRATPASEQESLIPSGAEILEIERLVAPLDPRQPKVIAAYVQPAEIAAFLQGIPG